jgi:hypothetical protein
MGQPLEMTNQGQAQYCWGEAAFLWCLDENDGACLPATETVCNGDEVWMAWSQCGEPPAPWEQCDPPGQVNGDC